MPVIKSADAPVYELHGSTFTGLAAPSRGSVENAVWRTRIAPGTPSTPHTLDREEILVVLAGHGTATLDGLSHPIAPGDALIVPPGTRLDLRAGGPEPIELVAVLPVGAKGTILATGETISPPWAQ